MNCITFLLLGITTVSLINAESASIELVDDNSPCFDKNLQEDFDKGCAKVEEKISELEKEWDYIKALDTKHILYELGQRISTCHKCSKAVRELVFSAVIENDDQLKKLKEIKDRVKANDDNYKKMEYHRHLLWKRIDNAKQQQDSK